MNLTDLKKDDPGFKTGDAKKDDKKAEKNTLTRVVGNLL